MLSTLRHQEIFDPSPQPPVTLIGCGAIGSHIFTSLVELGLQNITAIDFDVIEAHNLANQAFLHRHIGWPKIEALKDLYDLKTGHPPPASCLFLNTRLPSPSVSIQGIVFLAVDTMKARREIFDTCIKNNPEVFFVIENRMAATHGNVLSFPSACPLASKDWLASLTTDDPSQTEVSACGSSMTVGPTAKILANLAVWQFIHMSNNLEALNNRVNVFLKPLMVSAS